MMDKRRSLKSGPSLIPCRLATKTWRADSRCVRHSVQEARFGGRGQREGHAQSNREKKTQRRAERGGHGGNGKWKMYVGVTWPKTLDVWFYQNSNSLQSSGAVLRLCTSSRQRLNSAENRLIQCPRGCLWSPEEMKNNNMGYLRCHCRNRACKICSQITTEGGGIVKLCVSLFLIKDKIDIKLFFNY